MFCYVTNIPLKNGEAEKFHVCCVNMFLILFDLPLLEIASGSTPHSLLPGHAYLFTSCQSKFIGLSDTVRKLERGLAEHTQIDLHTRQVEILPRTY